MSSHTLQCQMCARTFTSRRSDARYCSARCRKRAERDGRTAHKVYRPPSDQGQLPTPVGTGRVLSASTQPPTARSTADYAPADFRAAEWSKAQRVDVRLLEVDDFPHPAGSLDAAATTDALMNAALKSLSERGIPVHPTAAAIFHVYFSWVSGNIFTAGMAHAHQQRQRRDAALAGDQTAWTQLTPSNAPDDDAPTADAAAKSTAPTVTAPSSAKPSGGKKRSGRTASATTISTPTAPAAATSAANESPSPHGAEERTGFQVKRLSGIKVNPRQTVWR